MQSTLFRRLASAVLMLVMSGSALAADWTERSELNLRPGVTDISNEVYDLHMFVLWIMAVIGGLVVALILWSIVRHRRSRRPEAAHFHENVALEVFWTVIPFIILIVMAAPAFRLLVEMDDTSESELTVQVTGYRWQWSYEYLTWKDDNDVGVFFYSALATPPEQYNTPALSAGLFPYGTAAENYGKPAPQKDHNYMLEVDNKLVIPSGVKVRFLVTADDVIHSFFMPDFGIKKDAIPGFVNSVWVRVPEGNEGTYYGQCAELCGKGHAFMPIEVEVVSQDEFDGWLTEQQQLAAAGPDLTEFASLDEAMEVGAQRYAASCAVCHGAQGQGGIGPAFAGSDLMTKAENLEQHIDIVVNGKNAMPAFKAQLTPKEIAAVVTYERNAFGNETGDLVQPADVAK